ncbi:MAG TPA: Plug domain-containing protein [Gemmatimonadales bacterium]|nr:Plug domain-containing protein [Gemmatimonadales bacterium]
MSHRTRLTAVSTALLFVACAHATPQTNADTSNGRRIVTAEAIEQTGARTAWEALQRCVPFFTFKDGSRGQPGAIEHRGRSSIVLHDQPLIIMDGVELNDFMPLGTIPASDILEIEVLTGIDATTYYGTGATKGVIRIKTKGTGG